jgi:uncharacterized repeat protein (TIGR03843 family)
VPAEERQAPLNTEPSVADRLSTAELVVEGRLVSASNTTLYCRLVDPTDLTSTNPPVHELACIYKPISGERPLWDFPTGTLAAREVAAYEVSAVTGWDLIPLTILRDGPFGPGMCQVWVEHGELDDLIDVVPEGEVPPTWRSVVDAFDAAGDPVTLVHADDVELRRTAVLDAMINNADRKAGHLLPSELGLRVVDHGVCFNVDPKLRTVLWGWAGEPLTDDERAVVRKVRAALDGALGERLGELLDPEEVDMTIKRVDRLLRTGKFPQPQGWPALPWPPF